MTVALLPETLEEAVSQALYEKGHLALDRLERDAVDMVTELLQDWFERNWHEWLTNEDASLPAALTDPERDEAKREGWDEAVAWLRRQYPTASPVQQGVLADFGRRMVDEKERLWPGS